MSQSNKKDDEKDIKQRQKERKADRHIPTFPLFCNQTLVLRSQHTVPVEHHLLHILMPSVSNVYILLRCHLCGMCHCIPTLQLELWKEHQISTQKVHEIQVKPHMSLLNFCQFCLVEMKTSSLQSVFTVKYRRHIQYLNRTCWYSHSWNNNTKFTD